MTSRLPIFTMPARITIRFVVPIGYREGDYAQLHGNGGSGAIDWETPLTESVYQLFPDGAGIYGFGEAPFGRHPFGFAYAMRTAGFGRAPFGRHPFGYGATVIHITSEVRLCGAYKFGLACYDAAGNVHTGSPQELEVPVHIAPPAPEGLSKGTYDKATDVLVLNSIS